MRETDLPEALAFLQEGGSAHEPLHRRASFLESSFESNLWNLRIGDWQLTVDFEIEVGANLRLVDSKCRGLLNVLKSWICVQDHPDAAKGLILAPGSMRNRIHAVLHLIDYLLINAEILGLTKHGLATISRSDVYNLFTQLATYRDVSTSVYQWPHKLTTYLRAHGSAMQPADVRAILIECPLIERYIPSSDERMLSLTDEEIVLARAFLYQKGLFRRRKSSYRLSPNTLQLATHLYANTLFGRSDKPIPFELAVDPYEPITREFLVSPTRDYEGERRNVKSLVLYNEVLRALALVPRASIRADSDALRAWDKGLLQSTFAPRPIGRTATVPVPIILKALKNAIEFLLKYGDALVDTLVAITREAQSRGCARIELGEDIARLISPTLKPLGVVGWTTNECARNPNLPSITKDQYFYLLRNRPGLWDLLLVLVGACFVIVGMLTARRRGELCDLRPGTSLDSTGRYLCFFNRKSGPLGLRESTKRPIPKIGAKALQLLERMDSGLQELGIEADGPLFKWPACHGNGFTKLDPPRPGPPLDRFCDYFEVDLDEQGRRYYLRPHQFRRFFAMVFFWYGGFGLMDTLRWFLGHTDIEHLYRYITETTPGAVLQQEKAGYAAEALEHGDQEAEELRRVVLTHFGASAVSVIDQDELKEYIESLIHRGGVAVEPIFLSEAGGKTFRVAITVTQQA
jgi:hypothetical protein